MWWCPTAPASRCPSSSSPRCSGSATVYLEVYDRIDSRTLTGRLCCAVHGPVLRPVARAAGALPRFAADRPAPVSASNSGLVLVVVGTDHHPFDRVVGWADEWAASHAGVRVLVQYGTSRPPTTAEGHDLLPVGDLTALMSEAAAVVCHGGPGTIMGAREAGHVPIVVPRRSDLGEHVDDHQVRFATRVAAAGQVHLATDQPTFSNLLERAGAGEAGFRIDLASEDPAAEAVARFASIGGCVAGAEGWHEASTLAVLGGRAGGQQPPGGSRASGLRPVQPWDRRRERTSTRGRGLCEPLRSASRSATNDAVASHPSALSKSPDATASA